MKRTILIKFDDNARAQRATIGISHEELAERAERHRTHVGDTEFVESNVALVNIVALTRGLNITLRNYARDCRLRHTCSECKKGGFQL